MTRLTRGDVATNDFEPFLKNGQTCYRHKKTGVELDEAGMANLKQGRADMLNAIGSGSYAPGGRH